jgi:polysaccharide export outer membrane protein
MSTSQPEKASKNGNLIVIASAAELAGVRKNSTADVGVIMRQSIKIRELIFMVVLSALFTLAMNHGAWAQATSSSPASSRVDQPADSLADRSVPGGTAMPTQKTPTVPAIGAGDLLKISVLGAPESDQEVRVGADGNVVLNFIGPVEVAGKTTEQAQAAIAKKMVAGGFFTDPQVSVFAKEYATQGVSVLGEVQKPGVYPLLGARTLFDLLSVAGGTTPKAGKVVSITHRDTPMTPTSVSLSNDATESVHSNIAIFPGDTIVVSKAGIVYVVGDVHRPSGVAMENGSMTVLQAIAMAEGANATAALNKAKLIRRTPSGPLELPLALKDMLASKSPDVRLQAEDIIFVPNSVAKSATRRSLEAAIQMATGLAIYGVR